MQIYGVAKNETKNAFTCLENELRT